MGKKVRTKEFIKARYDLAIKQHSEFYHLYHILENKDSLATLKYYDGLISAFAYVLFLSDEDIYNDKKLAVISPAVLPFLASEYEQSGNINAKEEILHGK